MRKDTLFYYNTRTYHIDVDIANQFTALVQKVVDPSVKNVADLHIFRDENGLQLQIESHGEVKAEAADYNPKLFEQYLMDSDDPYAILLLLEEKLQEMEESIDE